MADNYQLGDVDIIDAVLYSERGVINIKSMIIAFSVYESIFTPGIVCDIRVLDINDQLGSMRMAGDENLDLKFKVMGSETASYVFAVHELAELESTGAQKSKMYTLKCVSEEAMYAKTNFVQKSYNQLCSEMVQDIHTNYLKSSKPIELEPTRGAQSIIIPHRNPYDAVNLVRRRSVSSDNRSSLFLFFENRKEERQTFNFVTMERLFLQEPVKIFQQSDAINTSIYNRNDNNILAYRIPNQFSSIDTIMYGGRRRISTFNFTTWQSETRDVETSDTVFNDAGTGSTNSWTFRNRYFNADIPPQSLIPIDISQRPETFIPESSADLQAFVALITQNCIKIRVVGDTIITAGSTIVCTIPNKRDVTDNGVEDPLITGKFLVTRVHHRVGEFAERPRYTCIIECVKGRYEESIAIND